MRLYPRYAHSATGLAALGAAALLVGGADRYARSLIAEKAAELAPLNLPEATRGVALQHQILRQPAFLPVYGSSELAIDQPTRPALFFQTHPRGFAVFPIGSAGDRCLIILQELAAMADVIRGRRVVIFLSPPWFTPPGLRQDHSAHRQFASRYSPLEAGATLFGDALSPGLKRDIAGRLLDYGSVLRAGSPLLEIACAQRRSSAWSGAAALALLAPLGAAEDLTLSIQDRWQTLQLIRGRHSLEPAARLTGARLDPIDWTGLAASLDGATQSAATAPRPSPARDSDAAFLRRMDESREWIDFALLLRTIRELGANALLIGQPINGALSERSGVSARARQVYYDRIQHLAAANAVPLRDFSSHEDEPGFFADLVHPSARAWLYYDQALDEFYHRPAG